jgi:hypothetical protein
MSSSTIKENLDPDGRYTDQDVNSALQKACLGELTSNSGASSLSAG